jgi:hypothetical protein
MSLRTTFAEERGGEVLRASLHGSLDGATAPTLDVDLTTRIRAGISLLVLDMKHLDLDLLTRISPKPKMIGVICDPAKSGYLVKRAQQAARGRGIELAVRVPNVALPQRASRSCI